MLRRSGSATGLLIVAAVVGIAVMVVRGARPTPVLIASFVMLFGAAAILLVWARWQREVAVREAAIPQFLKRKLRERYA
ncbi:MAG: hypothetical protein ABIV63_15830, partial [Caldimonas sp.]